MYQIRKVGLFYSFSSKNTARIAAGIHNALSGVDVELVNVDDIKASKFSEFENLILGVPTWFDGELPNYWDELIPALEDIDFLTEENSNFWTWRSKGICRKFL